MTVADLLWLILRNVDGPKKTFCGTEILVFDFEFCMGARVQKDREKSCGNGDLTLSSS
jgi:hypothetical protein